MSLTSGFFNSVIGADGKPDRTYNSRDISNLFTGLILDGIFMSVGDQLRVTVDNGNNVYVGEGKAWFNGTWTINDAPLQIYCEEAEVLQDRIDAIVLEVDLRDSVRNNTIKHIKGTASSKPTKPVLKHEELLHQYALCYIYRTAGATAITPAKIENAVGTSETPFVTGVVQGIDLDELLGQWRAQLDEFVADETSKLNTDLDRIEAEYRSRLATMNAEMEADVSETEAWAAQQKAFIEGWFSEIIDAFEGDVATNLQLQIDRDEIKQVLMHGFVDGTKNMSSDGTVITAEDSNGRTLTTTFTNNFLTITTVLNSAEGAEIGRLVKNLSADGSIITYDITMVL